MSEGAVAIDDNGVAGAFRELLRGRTARERAVIGMKLFSGSLVVGFLALVIGICFPIFVLTTASSATVSAVRVSLIWLWCRVRGIERD